MIRIHSLHKFFNKNKSNQLHVLNEISLDLPASGMVAIFGKSGCGKTTLLNVLGGLSDYERGEVTVDGQDIGKNTDDLRNRYMGYIFQNYNLNKKATVFDNVADALRLCGITDKTVIESRTMAALANVGMEKYRNRTPDNLSGGQQQRVAIARAIVKNPRIILADEPTGNLDEANTIMVMDLLREIARDHLVILVTHEANLVDYYCDRVIELQDGQVVGERSNAAAGGYTVRDKNDIYLGELEKTEIRDDRAAVEYYGDAPAVPVKMTVVTYRGKTYVRMETPGVQMLDEGSEIRLREGVFEAQERGNNADRHIDMSALPPVEGSRYGRLFSFKSAVKSGYAANFKSLKKGQKALRRCMGMFAATLVLMTSVFATSIRDVLNINESYNHNVMYVYTPSGSLSSALLGAEEKAESGIDYVRLVPTYDGCMDRQVEFRVGFFETFTNSYGTDLSATAVLLDQRLAAGLPLLCGSRDGLSDGDVLISSAVADRLVKNSTLGYIKEHDDLVGLVSTSVSVNGKSVRIAGVVQSDETAVYLTELAMSRYVLQSDGQLSVILADDMSEQVAKGATILLLPYRNDGVDYPAVGKTVTIGGMELLVTAVREKYADYPSFLKGNGLERLDMKAWLEQQPKEGSESMLYYDYMAYYYAYAEDYLNHCYLFETDNMYLFMTVEKGEAWLGYYYMDSDFAAAMLFKEQHGRFPDTDKDMETAWMEAKEELNRVDSLYWDLYYQEVGKNDNSIRTSTYVLCREDYVALSRRTGDTHESAVSNYYSTKPYEPYYEDVYVEEMYGISVDMDMEYVGQVTVGSQHTLYTLIHTTDPAKTQAYLENLLAEHRVEDTKYIDVLIAPADIRNQLIQNDLPAIVRGLVTLLVVLVVMCVCMYFIMRSSMMNRIKEIGVYRAIGVSRGNLVFRFLVETAVLTTLTVFIGFLACSVLMGVWVSSSPLLTELLYYPAWLAAGLLVILYAVCLAFGVLPVWALTRKPPSDILAKYDI